MDDNNDLNIPPDSSSAEDLMREVGIPPDEPEQSEVPEEEPSNSDEEVGLSQDAIDDVLKDVASGRFGSEDMEKTPEERTVQNAEFQQLSMTSGQKASQNIDLLMDVELPVSIELGRTKMNIADILALGPGSVVELDKLVGEPVDLLVNQKCVARGEVVVVEESFGLRITQLLSPEERIKNLK
jgi:flagellar motor switch protein FliN/FliY